MTGPVLVTGAAGFVGSHLLDLLRHDDAPVTAWRKPSGSHQQTGRSTSASAPAVTWHAVDLLDQNAVTSAVAALRPVAVYHCAAAAHVGNSWDRTHDTIETNVRGTHCLFRALRQADVRARVLIPGSALVYKQSRDALREDDALGPASPYAVSKLAQERLGARCAEEGGQAVVLTRSFNHVGPGQAPFFAASSFARWIAEIEAGRAEPTIFVGNLDAQRDLTDVRDTVRAYELLMQRGLPGRVYNVCSGRARSIRSILDGLLAEARVPVSVQVNPSRFRPNDTPVLLGDPRRIRDEIGWKPEIPMERTLHDLLDHWRGVVRSPREPSADAGEA